MKRITVQMLLDLATLAIAAHSLVVGFVLLAFPTWMLKTVGWEYTGEIFWPSQAGLFLIILGTVYAAAVKYRPLIWALIGSKGSAIVFLLAHVIWLDAPKLVLPLGAIDGMMGLAIAVLYCLWKKQTAADQGTDG